MFKKIVFRGCLGFVFGAFLSEFLGLVSSAIYGKGDYNPISSYLLGLCGNEIFSAWIMFLLSGLMGLLYGSTSLIFESEKLNIVNQTLLHSVINGPIMFSIAWVCNWMHHSKLGIIVFLVEYIIVYVVIWLSFYLTYKRKVKEVNETLQKQNQQLKK